MVRYPAVHQACSINQSMISILITEDPTLVVASLKYNVTDDLYIFFWCGPETLNGWSQPDRTSGAGEWDRKGAGPAAQFAVRLSACIRKSGIHLAFCCRARNHTGWPIRKGDSNLVVVGSHPKRTISNLIWTSVLFRSLLWMFFKITCTTTLCLLLVPKNMTHHQPSLSYLLIWCSRAAMVRSSEW
jgi:hypothetical protein